MAGAEIATLDYEAREEESWSLRITEPRTSPSLSTSEQRDEFLSR